MKTQGRQNAMVKTYPVISATWNTRPGLLRASNGPTMVDQVTKVDTKPTNHSKFTGKCGRRTCNECYMFPPSSKSKDKKKAKGVQRLKSSFNVPDYRPTTWKVVDTKSSMKLSGFSTTDVLDYLDRIDCMNPYYEGGDEETQC
ncbi:hypothetical protein AAHA92_06627 [Salvia divinorum]|uniref:Uncharacterized protein n=1 Tax=Salvia divinorum TaxID=28513 RepID=A0ABD1I7C6_SALDI